MKPAKKTQNKNDNILYILGDADQIRRTIEGYLFSQDLEALREFSKSLTHAIESFAKAAERLGAEIIFAGGDDILFRIPISKFSAIDIRNFMKLFEEESGSTISIGVGSTPEEAFINLAKAKASGPGTFYLKDSTDAKKKLTNKFLVSRNFGKPYTGALPCGCEKVPLRKLMG